MAVLKNDWSSSHRPTLGEYRKREQLALEGEGGPREVTDPTQSSATHPDPESIARWSLAFGPLA